RELLHAPRSATADWSVVLPFCETLRNTFELMCPVDSIGLRSGTNGRCYTFLPQANEDDDECLSMVKAWHQTVGKYVAIRDCLALSFAIDYDRQGGNPQRRRTRIGELRARAKPY